MVCWDTNFHYFNLVYYFHRVSMVCWDLQFPLIPLLPPLPQGVNAVVRCKTSINSTTSNISTSSTGCYALVRFTTSTTPLLPRRVYNMVRFTTSTNPTGCLCSGQIYNFHHFRKVSILWWDLQLPLLPQGVYCMVRFSTSTTSTGCLWYCEIYNFH